jgi:hypothetical protein
MARETIGKMERMIDAQIDDLNKVFLSLQRNTEKVVRDMAKIEARFPGLSTYNKPMSIAMPMIATMRCVEMLSHLRQALPDRDEWLTPDCTEVFSAAIDQSLDVYRVIECNTNAILTFDAELKNLWPTELV